MTNLLEAIYAYLEEITPRVKKHKLFSEALKSDLLYVMYTLILMAEKHREKAKIQVDGVDYELSEYSYPVNMVNLAKAGRVYAAKGSIGRVKPFFQVTADNYYWGEGSDGEKRLVKTVTPEFVKAFWEDLGIPTVNYSNADSDYTISDCAAFMSEDRELLSFGEGSKAISDYIVQILGIPTPICEDFLCSYSGYDERSLAVWLLGTQSGKAMSEKSAD